MKHDHCKTEGPDMSCMKNGNGKGLCKHSYQDCDDDSPCTKIGKGERKDDIGFLTLRLLGVLL